MNRASACAQGREGNPGRGNGTEAGKCRACVRTTDNSLMGGAQERCGPCARLRNWGSVLKGRALKGFEQVAVMSSELYSRTSGKPGCAMSAVKEGIPLLPSSAPHVPTNVPLKPAQRKRLGGRPHVGRHSRGRPRAAPFKS